MVCLDSCMPLSCLFFVTWMCTYVHLYIDYVLEHSRPASVCLLQLCAYLNNQRRYIIFMWYNTAKTRRSKRLYLSRGCAKKQSATTGILLLLIGRLKVGQPEGGKHARYCPCLYHYASVEEQKQATQARLELTTSSVPWHHFSLWQEKVIIGNSLDWVSKFVLVR